MLRVLAGILLLAGPAAAHEIDLHKLPLGDGKLSRAPKAGWIWACHTDPNAGGAFRDGPWIDRKTGTYDLTAKIVVGGNVRWPHQFKITIKSGKRVFIANDLPNHATGRFPIAPNDPAYHFDTNPNRIQSQTVHFELAAMPTLAKRARCAPAAVGILLTGVALFNALDAPGRDAVAHETQDRCHGHPQQGGVYHYHSLTNCIDDKPGPDGSSPLVGYAIDGFGIYGPYENGRQLTTADLDACHGRTGPVDWDGRKVTMYHYVATVDFPYTVGCLRGDYSRSLVRVLAGPPPQRGRFSGPGRRPPPGIRPPPGMGPLFGGPPPR
jgi:hypothetical protein